MKIDTAIEAVQDSEAELAKELRLLGERHSAEHDVSYLSQDLAGDSASRLDQLRPHAERHGAKPKTGDPTGTSGLMASVREKASELLGGTQASGAALLADLRNTYLVAQRAEIDWTILRQAAMAGRDAELLSAVDACHEEVEVTAKWLRTMIKTSAPQILVTG